MVIIITGATHTGKTLLAQRLLERHHYPCLSIDLLKMGLIRSGNTSLTPYDDARLEAYLWPIVREMIKTAVENRQSLIVEGGYIPHDWKESFEEKYLREIRYICLVMSKDYILRHFAQIQKYADVVENRISDDGCTIPYLIKENARYQHFCELHGYRYLFIDKGYHLDVDL